MSTCGDVARFLRALLRDAVFDAPETLATMTQTLDGLPRASGTSEETVSNAAMFLFRAEAADVTWWGHDGYWGTTAYTCPTRDVTIVTSHQRSDMPKDFRRMALVADAFIALEGL